MKLQRGSTKKLLLLTSAAVLSATLLMASPAAAAYDDGFTVPTTDGCGRVDFVDYGEGAPGGGNNDDYLVIHDFCADGHGVRAFALYNYASLGSKYNGNGLAGSPVVWDPIGNIGANEVISVRVCLFDGAGDTTGARCSGWVDHVMVDG